jgi:hypothetical protein
VQGHFAREPGPFSFNIDPDQDREGRFRGEEVACFAWIEFHKVVRIGTGQPQRSNVADASPCLWDVPLHQQAPKFPLMDDRLDFKDERLPEPFPD